MFTIHVLKFHTGQSLSPYRSRIIDSGAKDARRVIVKAARDVFGPTATVATSPETATAALPSGAEVVKVPGARFYRINADGWVGCGWIAFYPAPEDNPAGEFGAGRAAAIVRGWFTLCPNCGRGHGARQTICRGCGWRCTGTM